MKLNHFTSGNKNRGYALVITMCFLAVMLIVFASMMSWTTTNAVLTERNNLYNQSQVAAESGTEQVLAALISDFDNNLSFSTPSHYASMIPAMTSWPVQYTFSDTNGTAGQVSVGISSYGYTTNLPNQVASTAGMGNTITISAQATPINQRYNMTARVTQNVWMGVIPLFQYAIFYNMDLEINPGTAMTVNGRVHSNHNLYATGSSSGSPLTFGSSVEAALMATNHASPLDPQNQSRNGNDIYSNTNYPLQNVGTVNLPVGVNSTNSNANNPTNVLAILYPPPPQYAPPDYSDAYQSSNGQTYFENKVDLIITNAPNGVNGTLGTNIQVYYQNPNDSAMPLTYVQPDVTNVTAGATNYSYSFVTNASFYDYRQGATVQSVDINVGQLDAWMTSGAGTTYNNLNSSGPTSKGHAIWSIYAINSVPQTSFQMPAVRMVNGQMLPSSGLTVATPDPIYVKGDYNTTTDGINFSTVLGDVANTRPASLLADSLTLVSSNWSDSYDPSTPLASRLPVSTTLNAATLEGIVPSNGSYYSGGVENFVRLLEDWSSATTITYNGSIVVMFPSQIATNPWNFHPNVYGVPTRRWGFDLNFNQQGGLPPLTPNARSILRSGWSAN